MQPHATLLIASMHLSVVIPVCNEEPILTEEVSMILRSLASTFPEGQYEVVIIVNGSTDRTLQLSESFASSSSCVRVLSLPVAAYGNALKQGILAAAGEFVMLCNIDFWDGEFLHSALQKMERDGDDLVIGSKTMKGSRDHRPVLRRSITVLFNMFFRKIFGYHGTDTHGVKLLRRQTVTPLVRECTTFRELFDTELLLRAQHAGLCITDLPVGCTEKRKIRYWNLLKRVPRTIRDLLILHSMHRSWK